MKAKLIIAELQKAKEANKPLELKKEDYLEEFNTFEDFKKYIQPYAPSVIVKDEKDNIKIYY